MVIFQYGDTANMKVVTAEEVVKVTMVAAMVAIDQLAGYRL